MTDRLPPARLSVRLFGAVGVIFDSEPLRTFSSLRLQRFLTMIAIRNGPQHRSRLAFELWPNSDEDQALTKSKQGRIASHYPVSPGIGGERSVMGRRITLKGLLVLSAVATALGTRPTAANPEATAELSAGVWRSLVAGGTNLYDFPLTPLGRKRYETFRLDLDPALTCEPPGMPRGFYYLSPMEFEFSSETVTIRYETMDIVRTFAIDGPPVPDGTPHTPNGYSKAHWEGDALIVNTTHLTAGETTREGFPKSAEMTLQESFYVEAQDDAPHLVVSVTVTDPKNFARPYTTVNEFVLEPDWELLPFDCNTVEYEQ